MALDDIKKALGFGPEVELTEIAYVPAPETSKVFVYDSDTLTFTEALDLFEEVCVSVYKVAEPSLQAGLLAEQVHNCGVAYMGKFSEEQIALTREVFGDKLHIDVR